MDKIFNEYKRWAKKAIDDEKIRAELELIENNATEIEDRFYKETEFGTGGLRGVIGAGTNRMNIYVVGKATQGLSEYILENSNKSVAIAYDSRNYSDVFAKRAASVFAANGIKVYIYKTLMPTPVLSYTVRQLNCGAGIVITASHNPAKYNGYKVYGSDGCQITTDAANCIYSKICSVDVFEDVKSVCFDTALASGDIEYVSDSVLEGYYQNVEKQSINKGICKTTDLKVVYTPLNGAGNVPVREILKRIGVSCVDVVKEQENPDGNFPTCSYPNPEENEANALAVALAKKVNPDLVLATDPDCDRVGIASKDENGEYRLFTGNETGILLLDYILSERTKNKSLPEKPVVVKTIVTSAMAYRVAEKYNAQVIDVLTGFKFIGEQIGLLEKMNEQGRYVFGFEESYGYLIGTYARDKDAVVASMLICEMAAFYKTKSISLCQALENVYKKYGYYVHRLKTFVYEGARGSETMKSIMANIRKNPPVSVGRFVVESVSDYLTGTKTRMCDNSKEKLYLPKSDVIVFSLENGLEFVVRPSGTEPKLKIYLTTVSKSYDESVKLIDELESFTKELLK